MASSVSPTLPAHVRRPRSASLSTSPSDCQPWCQVPLVQSQLNTHSSIASSLFPRMWQNSLPYNFLRSSSKLLLSHFSTCCCSCCFQAFFGSIWLFDTFAESAHYRAARGFVGHGLLRCPGDVERLCLRGVIFVN